jgi:hypothetical protein
VVRRSWNKYFHCNAKEGDCQLVTAMNAYYLTGKIYCKQDFDRETNSNGWIFRDDLFWYFEGGMPHHPVLEMRWTYRLFGLKGMKKLHIPKNPWRK